MALRFSVPLTYVILVTNIRILLVALLPLLAWLIAHSPPQTLITFVLRLRKGATMCTGLTTECIMFALRRAAGNDMMHIL
jgi:hypothetical protein